MLVTEYLTLGSTAAACAPTFSIYLAPGGFVAGSAYGDSSWVSITATGDVKVDSNTLGLKEIMVRWSQPDPTGSSPIILTSTMFRIEVICPVFTTPAPAVDKSLNPPFPAASAASIVLQGVEYRVINSAAAACVITYSLYEAPAGVRAAIVYQDTTWLSFSTTTGDVTIDMNKLGVIELIVLLT